MKVRPWLMMYRDKRKIALTVILIVLGLYVSFKRVTLLQLENMDYSRIAQLRISPSNKFSIYHINSIYNEAVTEEYQAINDNIVLKGVRTKSAGVLEYYGFEEVKDYIAITRNIKTMYIRVGTQFSQKVKCNNGRIVLSEIGDNGDRLQIKIRTVPSGYYFLSKLSRLLF